MINPGVPALNAKNFSCCYMNLEVRTPSVAVSTASYSYKWQCFHLVFFFKLPTLLVLE